MPMWETLRKNQIVRVGAAIALALAAVVALIVVLKSSGGLGNPAFNELFPPPPPELSVTQKIQVVQSVSSSSRSSSTPPVTEEEKSATLQELRATSATDIHVSDEEKMRVLQQTGSQN
ncbi:MAG: hypothetical protein NUV59_04385 [Patescibacteria group bacterium]|nr:hypothetical protein [Patescibacteria group bacterium]